VEEEQTIANCKWKKNRQYNGQKKNNRQYNGKKKNNRQYNGQKKWTQRQTMVGDCTEKPDNTIVKKRKTNVGNMINMEKTDKTLTK
jgi:hypothetical protein